MLREFAILALVVLPVIGPATSRAQVPAVRFAERLDAPVGEGPFDLVVADFNKDNNADVATANNDGGNVSVLWGNGDGSFEAAVTAQAGEFPIAIATGLVTNDSNLDLVVANEVSQELSVLKGGGTGKSFGSAVNTEPVATAAAVVLADFDNDGKLDAATSEIYEDTVTVQLGNGDANGTFGLARSLSVPGGPFGLAVADFDGDDKLDLVTTNSNSTTVTILKGNGDGTFALGASPSVASSSCSTTVTPAGVTTGDVNGDNKPDIVATNEDCDNVAVLINDGDGTFGAARFLDSGLFGFPEAARIADLNGDGYADIAAANSYNDNVSVFLGHGDGMFEAAVFFTVDTTPFALAVADVNNDTFPDIVTANADGNNVSVLLNDRAGGCTGDCDASGDVTVDELVKGVNIALGTSPLSECSSFDKDNSGDVTVDELVSAVNIALGGCA